MKPLAFLHPGLALSLGLFLFILLFSTTGLRAQEVVQEAGAPKKEERTKLPRYDYDFTENYDPNELIDLAADPKKDTRRLMWLILRAGMERDRQFRNLIKDGELRAISSIDLALAGYDYMTNRTEVALDHILAKLATEAVGDDTNSILVLTFLDEWERIPKAYEKHFIKTDGAGATASWMFMQARHHLFPKEYKRYQAEKKAKEAERRKRALRFWIERQKKDQELFDQIEVGNSVFKYPGLIANGSVSYTIRRRPAPYWLHFGRTPKTKAEEQSGLKNFYLQLDDSGVVTKKYTPKYEW